MDVVRAAWVWGDLEVMAIASGVCPRCSVALDRSVTVCEAHDATDGLCEECDRRYAAQLHIRCTNCILELEGLLVSLRLMANTDLLAFPTTHGINPLTTQEWVTANYGEEIVSTEPFEARFTSTIDEDTLALTVDEDLNVSKVTR